eukprot:gene32997-42413_t
MLSPENATLLPGLYIVATPIGNLGDMTRRAIAVLGAVSAIACEDTRVTGKLMAHLGLKKPLRRYDDHADAAARDALPAWRATSVAERADLMRRVHRLLVVRAEQIAQMVTAEVAKPIMAAREETFEYSAPSWGKAAEEILRYRGILLPSTQEKSNNKRLVLGHRPLG